MKENEVSTGATYSVETDGKTGLRRMTVSMGGGCPVGCAYCYTYDPKFQGYPRRNADQIVDELTRRVDEFDILQWGCDTEPFLPKNKEITLSSLERIARMKKHISFATRFVLTDGEIDRVASVAQTMKADQKFLAGFHSYLGRRAIAELEPHAPSADERLDGMRRLYNAGIFTFIFIRPLLPTITDQELDGIIAETKNHCHGHVVGEVFYRDSVDGVTSPNRQRKHIDLGLVSPTRQGASMSFGPDTGDWNVFADPRIQRLVGQHENVFAHSSEVFPFLAEKFPSN